MQHRKGVEARNISKLTGLYGGNIKLPQPRTAFINLVPGLELTDDQEELLNLGLNCHFMTKPRPHRKRLELEILLDDIKTLEKAKKVTTSDNLPANILTEAGKTRGSFQSQILQKTPHSSQITRRKLRHYYKNNRQDRCHRHCPKRRIPRKNVHHPTRHNKIQENNREPN